MGQYRVSDRGVFDEREGEGKGHTLHSNILSQKGSGNMAEVDYQG